MLKAKARDVKRKRKVGVIHKDNALLEAFIKKIENDPESVSEEELTKIVELMPKYLDKQEIESLNEIVKEEEEVPPAAPETL